MEASIYCIWSPEVVELKYRTVGEVTSFMHVEGDLQRGEMFSVML